MRHTKEEILNALQIIKDECNGTPCCDCPFGGTEGHTPESNCLLRKKMPVYWKIAEREEGWKALE